MPKQDGGPILRSHGETCRGIQHIRHLQISGSNTTIGSRTKVGILGDSNLGLNKSDFQVQKFLFACRKVPGNRRDTPAARHSFTCTVTPQVTQHR